MRTILTLGLVLSLACLGCSKRQEQLVPAHAPTSDDRLVLTLVGRQVTVDLALNNATRSYGLKNRQSMDEDAGMLFVFPDSAPRTFWMQDTLLSLDILFLDEQGTILNIEQAPPFVERPGFHSRLPARFVLELNQGWCERHGLKPGAVVAVPPEVVARGV